MSIFICRNLSLLLCHLQIGNDLHIQFNYIVPDKAKKQETLNSEAVERVFNTKGITQWIHELAIPAPTEKDKKRTLLERHLTDFTARNTFDYFIHKDLGEFLRRELDFFIKNEILHVDDIDLGDEQQFLQYITEIRVMKSIGHKIITFLEQIENYQKKLWLKKKFVIDTNYCITLDRVPEELYPDIIANQEQVNEWVSLYAIDEIDGDLMNPGYTEPLSVDFCKKNPYLLLDTKHFERDFVDKLLSRVENLDESTDGLLINSENFQALNLIHERYRDTVKLVYIDPPYNIDGDGFIYKDGFKSSTWMSMMSDRLLLGARLLAPDGTAYTSIGKDEEGHLRLLLDSIFHIPSIPYVWKSRAKPTNAGQAKYRPQIVAEFVFQNMHSSNVKYLPLSSGIERRYPHRDEHGKYRTTSILTSNLGRYQRETMRFTIDGYTPPPDKRWKAGEEEIQELFDNHRIDFNEDGEPHRKHYEGDEEEQHIPLWTFIPEEISGTAESGKGDLSDIVGADHGMDTVKPKELLQYFINSVCPKESSLIVDYFAGSGTTGHAVISLNREDEGKRKYILVEMGRHFDTILLPRIKKVIYSRDWKKGKPVSREGVSHMFKYMKLESYEDTLNNIQLRPSDLQCKRQVLLDKFRQIILDTLRHFYPRIVLRFFMR